MNGHGDLAFAGTDRFRILHRLGRGGSGAVYAARDRESGCDVALKVLHDTNPETLLLLKNEFRSMAEIHHPNLVRLGELVEDDGQWFVSMELVDGIDALTYVRPEGGGSDTAFDERRLRHVLPQMVLGLSALHAAGKVHCDVNPSNVMVTAEGRVVILDFGIIRDVGRRTTTGRGFEGTPAFMAPEQVLGDDVGPAADLYGLGAFLYAALTGEPPFTGCVQEILEAKVSLIPPPPRGRAPGIPRDLDAICVALLDVDPSARPTADDVLVRLGGKRASTVSLVPAVFVGRARELDALESAMDDTRKGAPVTVVLQGESGIGKSYLAGEFLLRAVRERSGLIVLEGKCYEQESVPYKGVDGIVDELTRVLSQLPAEEVTPLLPDDVAYLRPLFPVIDRIAEVQRASKLPPAPNDYDRRQRAVAALRELLVRVARRSSVVVRIEDLHWANADTLQLLGDVLRPPGAPALLVVVTQRPSSRGGGASRLDALPGDVRVVEVGTFSANDTRDLVERLLGTSADELATSRVVETVARETRGHPLFIHELVAERGLSSANCATVRLDEALWARVLALPAESRGVVESVCLAGLPLSQELLAATEGIDLTTLAAHLPRLRAQRLVRGSGARRADVIEPYHDRVRESVVRHLTGERRRGLHQRLAVSLEMQGAAPDDVLAFHWEGAGDTARARAALVRAADGAASAFAFDYAADLYRRALALGKDDAARLQPIEERLGDALRNAGRGREAADAYEHAAASTTRTRALDLRRRAAEQRLTSGQFDEGRAAFRSVLAEEGMSIAWTPLASVVLGLLRRVWLVLRGLRFRARTESQVDPALLRQMEVLWNALRGLCLLDASLLFDLTVRLALLALRAGEPTRVGRFVSVEAMSVAAAGDLIRAQELVDYAAPLTAAAGDPHTLGMHVMAQALVDFYANRWLRVVERAEATTALFQRSHGGVAWETAVIQQFRLIAMFRAGQLRRLATASRALFDDAERRGDYFGMSSSAVGHPAMVHLAADRPDAGRAVVDAIMTRWTRDAFLYQHYHAFLFEVSADLYVGDGAAAWARIETTWRAMRGSYLLLFPEIAHEAHHLRARAALAYARVLPERSPLRSSLLRTASADARKLCARRVPWPRANGALVRAGVASLRGDDEGARRHLERAVALFTDATPMPLLAASARRQIGSLLGGDAGKAMVDEADAALRAEDVVRPDAFASMLVGTPTRR